MNFLKPVNRCHCTEVTTGVLASDEVKTGKLHGRHAIAVLATSDCRIGDEIVLKKKTVGFLVKEGEQVVIPVESSRWDMLYVNGACDLTEFF